MNTPDCHFTCIYNMDICLSTKILFYTIPENKYPYARNKRAVGKIGN